MTTFDESKHPRAAGGQFRETLHAESSVTLGGYSREQVREHGAFIAHQRLVRNKQGQIDQAQKELDQLNFTGAKMAARTVVPGATELRLRYELGYTRPGHYVPSGIRTAEGEVIPAGTSTTGGWNFKSPADEVRAPSITTMIEGIKGQSNLFEADKNTEFDPTTDEWVLYLDGRTSSEHENG